MCILIAITLVYLIHHSTRQSRAGALSILIFLVATQVHNLLFHVGGTIVFRDFSPGTITAVLLYLPVNVVILRKASEEGWINWKSGVMLFLLGGAMFWTAEAFGPPAFIFAVLGTWIWIAVSGAGARTTESTSA